MTSDESVLFGELVEKQAARSPENLAAVFGATRWTYSQLNHRVGACARALIAAGIQKGDRVALLGSPRFEFIVVFLAAARIGAMWVGLNPVQTANEYRHILADSRPSLLFAFRHTRGRDNLDILRTLAEESPFIRSTILLDDWDAPQSPYAAFIDNGSGVPDGEWKRRIANIAPGDGALIVYTSGSTGRPKGAVLTHDNIGFSARLYCELWPLEPLRVICNLPITHVASCVETVAYSIAAGGAVIFQEQFDAAEYLQAIEREGVNWTPLVPTMFQRILAVPDWRRYDTSSLRVILFGGAAMPANMIEELQRLSTTVVGCWGMTETTSGITFTDSNDSLDVLSSSVGRPARGCEVALMGSDGLLLDGEGPGEIVVRGRCVFKGYFGLEEATGDAIDVAGWLHSGDVGRRDAEGRLYVAGRIKEMFKSGGYNVYPREVEIAIEAHPAIAMAVVVPVPDPVYQEVGTAYVLPHAGQKIAVAEVSAHCRGRLANYKVPKRVIIRDRLPMLANGKIDRAALQKEAVSQAQSALDIVDITFPVAAALQKE
ncbi:class I adenylate-forming enzyme family protein [soil metagenome]